MLLIVSALANEWVSIPAGSFTMGCDPAIEAACNADESPKHSVSLSSFSIQKTEVTQDEWAECVADGSCSSYVEHWNSSDYGSWPATGMNRFEADAYCQWQGGRLPTEAEWEYAALGNDGRMFPWGNEPVTCDRAQLRGCGSHLGPVGQYPKGASPFGVLDMIGNAWEFVADYYSNKYYSESASENPQGPSPGTMVGIRGVNTFNLLNIRTTQRMTGPVMVRSSVLGFRCAKDEVLQ